MTSSIGSVKRHLQDTPKLIGNLVKSLVKECKIIMSKDAYNDVNVKDDDI